MTPSPGGAPSTPRPSSPHCARAASRASDRTSTRREAGPFLLDESLAAVSYDTLARLVAFPDGRDTSHQASRTEEAAGRTVRATVGNVLDYRAGRRSENVPVPRS